MLANKCGGVSESENVRVYAVLMEPGFLFQDEDPLPSVMLPVMEFVLPANSAASSSVPAFLAKLWKMVDDPETNHLIEWSDEGHSFLIHNQADFAQSLLPYYYKHSNMASFVRQLNMYGFHKVVGVDTGGLKSERQEEMEFAHDFFRRGMEFLLDKIKRKVSNNKGTHYAPAMKSERVTEVLSEVSVIKDRQEDLDGKLDTMKKENEALWREVVSLRQKHQSQQKIVNKLIQFLVGMVQPRMGNAVKRRYPSQLAIADTYGKEARLDGGENGKASGPIIRDVTHESPQSAGQKAASAGLKLNTNVSQEIMSALSQFQESNQQQQARENSHPQSPINIELPDTPEPQPTTGGGSMASPTQASWAHKMTRAVSPVSSAVMQAVDPKLVNPTISSAALATATPTYSAKSPTKLPPPTNNPSNGTNKPMTKAVTPTRSPNRPTLHREISREDFDAEMSMTTKDLDNLKDILSGQITLDPNLISNIFTPEEPFGNLYSGGSDFPLQLDLGWPNLTDPTQPSSSHHVPAIEDGSAPTLFELNGLSDRDQDHLLPPKMMGDNVQSLLNEDDGNTVDVDDSMLHTPKVVSDNSNPLSFSLRR